MTADVYLVRVEADIEALLAESAPAGTTFRQVDAPEEARAGGANRPVVLVLGTGVENPVRLAEHMCTDYKYCTTLILAPPERHAELARTVQFSPFLSSTVACFSTADRARISTTFRRLVQQAAQQRAYASMVASAQEQIGQPVAAEAPMRYLDRLLDLAPVGVIVIDAAGIVRAWNRWAGIIFGRGEREAIGERFETYFPDAERAHLRRLLTDADAVPDPAFDAGRDPAAGVPFTDTASSPRTVERRSPDGAAQYVEITATTFTDARQGTVTMVVVLDVTGRVVAEMDARRLGERAAVAEALARQADALRKLNVQLEQRNRELQDFAYVASHDLQEPLRKIRTFADLVAVDYHDAIDEEGRFLLGRVQDAAERMAELLKALLAYSRVTSRGQPFEEIDLNVVAAHVAVDLELLIEESGGNVERSTLPTIEADPVQMRQLLQNLISNALKFRRPDVAPVVSISGRRAAGEGAYQGTEVCHLEVSDNGIGFEEKYLDRIFAPFQRLHNRANFAGTGMGLAICRRIVERHGGTIEARSRPDVGSTFLVTLPARHPPDDAAD